MIKILQSKEDSENIKPYYRLSITLGYGEHCDDAFTNSWIEINDEKAEKYARLSDEEMDNMSWQELSKIEKCITQEEAENVVKFFDSLWDRKNKEGFEVDHVVLNDGKNDFWWKEQAAMTDMEFDWFSGFYDEFQCTFFNPQIENNWYGIFNVNIEYVDENNKVHKCEVV